MRAQVLVHKPISKTVVCDLERACVFLEYLEQNPHDVYGIDCETQGIDPRKQAPGLGVGEIVCWSLAYETPKQIVRVFLPASALSVFKDWLEDPEVKKVGHNVFSFDRHMFLNAGINLQGLVGDTLYMAKLETNHPLMRYGLKKRAYEDLGIEMQDYVTLFSRPKRLADKVYKPGTRKVKGVPTTYAEGPVSRFSHSQNNRELIPLGDIAKLYPNRLSILHDYASLDAAATLLLYQLYKKRLKNKPWKQDRNMFEFYEEIWNPSLYVLTFAERKGFYLDEDICLTAHQANAEEIVRLQAILDEWTGGINVASPTQLVDFLYGYKNFDVPPVQGSRKAVKRTRRGEQPTSEAALDWLAENTNEPEMLKSLIRCRKLLKEQTRLTSFLAQRDKDERVHYSLRPSTDTGRLAASNIPIQQIPKEGFLREAFQATEGNLLCVCDYSQLELYILAHFLYAQFGCSKLGEALQASDIHQTIADEIGYPRDFAKAVVYAINYGKGAGSLAAQLKVETYEAQGLLDMFAERYPAIGKFQRYCKAKARRTGNIRTLLGRYREIPELQSKDKFEQGVGERKSINTPVQGSAADLVTMAMLKCNTVPMPELVARGYYHKGLHDLGSELLVQVHDELIFELPEENAEAALPLIITRMENPLTTPLAFGSPVSGCVAKTWKAGK